MILDIIQSILQIDKTLPYLIETYGLWVYAILCFIIFAETGLVIFPFLPGDSLIFLIGAICANGKISLVTSSILITLSAILGNIVNYHIGKTIGDNIYKKNYKLIDKSYLEKAQHFFYKHGGKAVILARFLPILRTFIPFIAGISKMNTKYFYICNILGALIWVNTFLILGYIFGNIPFIKQNLDIIVLVGFAAAVVPIIFATLFKKFKLSK